MTYINNPKIGLPPGRRSFSALWALLAKAPASAKVGLIVIGLYALTAILAPFLAPYGEAEIVSSIPFAPWSADNWFGTDQLGRDMLSRLIYGARNTLGIAVMTTAQWGAR